MYLSARPKRRDGLIKQSNPINQMKKLIKSGRKSGVNLLQPHIPERNGTFKSATSANGARQLII